MDFSFTDEQQEIAGLARRILTDKVTPELLRAVEAGADRFDRELWSTLADAGVLGIALPDDAGGGGYGLIEQCLVLEEVGRRLAPVPVWASTTAAAAIAAFGTAEQKQSWVAPAASGQKILAPALAEHFNPDATSPATTAAVDGDGWVLTGTKTAVPAGPLADLFLVPAATPDGVAVFLVEAGAPGVTVTRQHTTSRDSAALVELSGARVGAGALLGSVSEGQPVADWIVERATIGLCALQLGITEQALADTAEYAKSRIQFERPIGTFQAVGHRCADCYIDTEGLRLTTWQAAWRLSEDLPAALEVEVAKFWAAEAGHRVAHAAVHIHGGMGVATEHTIHRYFIWAKQVEFMLGGATQQLLRIGAALAATPA
jgi:alkylation response protein AidB-like acyl-CoA dehydrogenase